MPAGALPGLLPMRLAGAELIASPCGALFWPARRLLAVADLHLEKGSAFAGRGVPLPPYDTRATLARLARTVGAFRPETVICLGDSFHDDGGADRLAAADRDALVRLTCGRTWIWLAGNHDRRPPGAGLGGEVAAEAAIGPLVFRHAAERAELPPDAGGGTFGEVSGHYHPKASLVVAGCRTTRRCFVADGRRLILPAFGAYAGGLDVFEPAIADLLQPSFWVMLLGRCQVHRIACRRLSATPADRP